MNNWKEFSSDKPQEEFREGWAASQCRRYCSNSCHEPNNIKVKNPQNTDHCKSTSLQIALAGSNTAQMTNSRHWNGSLKQIITPLCQAQFGDAILPTTIKSGETK
jgi:hypothetical protein